MASIQEYTLKNGTTKYLYKVYLGIDPATGKKKRTTVRGFRTKTDAKNAAKEAEYMASIGNLEVKKETFLLKDYLNEWITKYKTGVKEGTMIVHRYNVNHYIIPHIGFYKVEEYNLQKHQLFINKLYDECHLATTTIRLINGTLHNAFKKAKQLGLVKNNPCDNAEFRRETNKRPSNLQYFNREESSKFLEQSKKEKEYIFYYLYLAAIDTGMRKAELMALQWDDVDFERNTINVDKCRLYRSEKGKKDTIILGAPKTENGYRTLIMSDRLAKALTELKEIQSLNKAKFWFNRKFKKYDFVFCYEDFRPIASKTTNQAFIRISERAGLKKMVMHDLRHTFAVMLREAGVSLEDIRDLMGHKSVEMTLIYAHVTPLVKENAMKKFDIHMDQNAK